MPFQPGQSGNPAGRAPGTKLFGPIIRRLLLEAGDKKGTPNLDLVALKLVSLAKGGNLAAIQMILDRVDGKVTDHIDHTSGGASFAFTLNLSGSAPDTLALGGPAPDTDEGDDDS